MSILVSGSLAYDYLMEYDGNFKDSILPGELEHLSVSFLASKRVEHFGGCSGNVAYSLKLLGEEPLIHAVCGNDFARYREWLIQNRIKVDGIVEDSESPTAAAYILSDSSASQIAMFSPAAMGNLKLAVGLDSLDLEGVKIALVAADLPERIYANCVDLKERGIKYVLDPGQGMSALFGDKLKFMVEASCGVIVNEYEGSLLEERLGKGLEEIASALEFLIVTLGEAGARAYGEEAGVVRAVAGLNDVDVTGCGDAFRAGFLHGYLAGANLHDTLRMANVVASFVVEVKGTQQHTFTLEEFEERLKSTYSK